MTEDEEIQAAISRAQALTGRLEWQDAAKRQDYGTMRAMMKAEGLDDTFIDVFFWKMTGSKQRLIWWQSLIKGCLLAAVVWLGSLALDTPLPWLILPVIILSFMAGEFWETRRRKS